MQDQELESYFTAIKTDFNSIHERLDGIDRRLDGIEGRLDRIENILFSILEVVKGQDLKFKDINQRLLVLEKRCL